MTELKLDLKNFTFLSEDPIYMKLMAPELYREFKKIMEEEVESNDSIL